MNTKLYLILLGLVLITSGCMNQSPEESTETTTTFNSDQEFIDYMNSESQASKTSYTESTESSTASQDAVSEQGSETEILARENSVKSSEWIQTTKNSILISHRDPRHFQSVKTPELELEHNISEVGGPTLVSENKTIIEEQDRIVGYDKEMNKEWSRSLNSSVQEMKLVKDRVVLLTRENDMNCPIRPMHDVEIACTSVLRPNYGGQTDYTYTLATLDAETGDEIDSTGFVASSMTQVEVTEETTFVSYSDRRPESEIMTDFLLNEASISGDMRERVQELQGYDLTDRSMQIELEAAMREYESENMKELEEEFSSYDEENMSDYEESALLKINNSDLSVTEDTFDGRITQIVSREELILKREFRGIDYQNRETEILRDGEILDTEGLEIGYQDVEKLGDKVLVNGENQLMVIDHEGNTDSIEVEAVNVETTQDKVLVSGAGENGSLTLYNSELEELDSIDLESRPAYYFEIVEADNRSYALINHHEGNRLMKVTDKLEMFDTEASGQLVYLEGLYTVADKVQRLSDEGEIEEEIEIQVPRMVRPLPEPLAED
ncbi:MAG: hypothetical protein R6V35_01295 [Candidatus Nanohaloarchaea archaeon]